MEENKLFIKLNIQRFASHLQTWGTYYRVSGTGSPSTRAGFDANGQIAVYLESQDTANNTSRIRIDHKIKIYRHSSATSYDSVFVENTSSYRANQGSQGGSYQSKTGTGGYNGNGTSSERVINLGSTYHTVYHNSDGTGRLYVNGSASLYVYIIYKDGNSTYAKTPMNSSFNVALPTIPRYANITTYTRTDITMTSFRVNWATSNTVDRVEYRINSGAWTLGQSGDRSSGNFTITGRNPGTTYNIQIRVRRKDSQLWTESANPTVTTLNIAKFVNVPNNINIDNPFTVTFNRNGASTVELGIYKDGSIEMALYRAVSGSSYTFELTEEEKNNLFNDMNTVNSGQYRVYIATNSNTYRDYINRTFNVVDANPTFSSFEYADTGGDTLIPEVKTTDLTGDNQTIIKGYSNLKATITSANKMEAIKGANPKEYQLVVGAKQIKANYSSSADVDLSLNAIDNNVFIVYAIDSRGNSTQKQISPSTYIDYFKPTISEVKASRQNNISSLTNLSFTGTFLNVDFGAETNEITAKYQYRNTKSDEWIIGVTELTLDISDNNFSFNGSIAGDLDAEGFSISESFEIKIIVEDLLSTNEKSEILVSATPNLSMHQDGTSINKQYDDTLGSGLQLNGENIYYNGILLFGWSDE